MACNNFLCPHAKQARPIRSNSLLLCSMKMKGGGEYLNIHEQAKVLCDYSYYCQRANRRMTTDEARTCPLYKTK